MSSIKPIQIVGFTPLGVILAERCSYLLLNNISLVGELSSSSIDIHWQSVSLFCLINLLKQCRILLSNSSKKFGINVCHVKINEQLLYTYIKLTTKFIQKYYLNLLKQRHVKFITTKNSEESFEPLLNKTDFPITTYITYSHSSYLEFDQSLRLNLFHAIFQDLLQNPTIKLIGDDIFTIELVHLLSSLGQNDVYFYRMNSNETSLIPHTKTNTSLVTLFQIFSKFNHQSLIQTIPNDQNRIHIIEQFHQFRMNRNAEGKLEYDKYIESVIPISQTREKTKKNKPTYLETFRQSAHESTLKITTSNIHTGESTKIEEEPLDHFPPSSTFFVLPDVNTLSDTPSPVEPSLFPNAIRTFNSTPGSMILNIYETLRTISNDEMIPHLTNIFLSIDHELCVLQKQIPINDNEFGMDRIIESPQHNLQKSVENLHDLYKIIQRPINQTNQLIFYESQLFLNDALDLQSLLLFFNSKKEIPQNELIFLFHNEYDWHNLLVLPDRV